MKSLVTLSALLAVLLVLPAGPAAQEAASTGELSAQTYTPVDAGVTKTDAVQVRYWADRTALFPGDRINYHLQIHCAAGVDLLTDDLDPGQIDLTGLELVDSGQTVSEQDGRRTYHVRYTLTTYDLNTPAMQIGAQTIRYYAGRGTGQADTRSPSGELVIPPTRLSLASTLAAEPMQSRLRDGVSSVIMAGGSGWIGSAGLLLVLFSGAPVGWWVAMLMRSRSGRIRQRDMEQAVVEAEQGVLDRLQGLAAASLQDRRQGYDRLDQLLREIITQNSGLRAEALTATELTARLAANDVGIPVDQLVAVMTDCELARYGRPPQLPEADRFMSGVELARRLLNTH